MRRRPRRALALDARLLEAWLQCERRAWLQHHAPERGAPGDGLEALLAVQRTDLMGWLRGENAAAATPRRAPQGSAPPGAPAPSRRVAYEVDVEAPLDALLPPAPAAEGEGVARARVDRLEHAPDGWTLATLASGTRVREHHLRRLALAGLVANARGIRARRAYVLHLDRSASRDRGAAVLRTVDVSDRWLERRARLPAALQGLVASLRSRKAPETRVGPHCLRPRRCPFAGHCWAGVERGSIYAVGGLRRGTRRAWRSAGWIGLDEVPPDAPGASPAEVAALDDVRARRVRVDRPRLKGALAQLAYPVAYLDLEFATPAVPLLPGTAPFDPLPFQFSLHLEHADGRVDHVTELCTDLSQDPRPRLAARLARALRGAGSLVVYDAGSEGRLLEALARAAPAHAEGLRRAAAALWDLLAVVRTGVRHPGFAARWDLKSVAAALAPGSYDGLALDDGAGAQALWRRSLPIRDAAVERTLRSYCASDSGAMLAIVRALRRLVAAGEQDDTGAAHRG